MHATEIIDNPLDEIPGVLALVGTEQSLKASVIKKVSASILGDADTPTRFSGASVEMKAVRDELLTISMWTERRVVVVEEASEFVTANRPALEKYAQKPARKSILVLDVKSMPKTTKLYKIIDKHGLVVDCAELKGAALVKFIQGLAARKHQKTIARDATQLLIELVGNHLGMLEQEVDKLSSYVGDSKSIDSETVRRLVGGWKAETTWAMTDAVKAGRLGHALACLDKLLNGGENEIKILGGIAYVFRKMAVATEYARQGVNLVVAIKKAGAFPHEVDAANGYLRRLGFAKAERISRWLLDTDAGLKGGSKLPERNQLELLLVKLAGQA
jgi:DNA polymerase-3 subunit delta